MRRPTAALRLAAILVGAILVGATLLAAAAPAAADEVSFRAADNVETVLVEGRERTVFTGAVEIIVNGTSIHADVVEAFGDDYGIIIARGAVRVIDREEDVEIASEHLLFDRERSVLRIQGSALLIDRANEVVVKGGFMEYHQESGEAIVQIGVRILKPDLVARSEFARYRRDDNTVDLSGMPVVTQDGDEYRAMRIFVDLNRDSVRMEGQIRGTVTVS